MPRPARRRNPVVRNITQLLLLGLGLVLVRQGLLPFWVWLLLTALAIVVRVLGGMDTVREELTVSDEGVRRRYGSPVRHTVVEEVSWDALMRVEVRTRETGAEGKDMLFLLYGGANQGVAVPGALAQQHGLVEQLRRRLPGFDEAQLAQATGTMEKTTFVLWEKGSAA